MSRCACPRSGAYYCTWCTALAARAGLPLPRASKARTEAQHVVVAHPTPTDRCREVLRVKLSFLYTRTESNTGGHWRPKHARARLQRQRTLGALIEAYGLWDASALSDHATIILTRIAPRALDAPGNLGSSLKHIEDGVADWLGIDDRDQRVTWHYRQQRGAPHEYAVAISIAP